MLVPLLTTWRNFKSKTFIFLTPTFSLLGFETGFVIISWCGYNQFGLKPKITDYQSFWGIYNAAQPFGILLNLFSCIQFLIILGCWLAFLSSIFHKFLQILQKFSLNVPSSLLLWQHKRATTLLFKCVLGGFIVSLILPTNKFFMLVGE